jgi:hypothetical protein
MRKIRQKSYLTTGDIAELTTWSRQYVLRDLKHGSLKRLATLCPGSGRQRKHYRVIDTQELRDFCAMVRDTPIDSRGHRRYEILMERETTEHLNAMPVRPGEVIVERPLPKFTRTPTKRPYW